MPLPGRTTDAPLLLPRRPGTTADSLLRRVLIVDPQLPWCIMRPATLVAAKRPQPRDQ